MRRSARTDLSGGRSVKIVSTATATTPFSNYGSSIIESIGLSRNDLSIPNIRHVFAIFATLRRVSGGALVNGASGDTSMTTGRGPSK
jgi:hypothetical protein